jgi:hypothetical protein
MAKQPIKIEVDPDKMVLGDLEVLERATEGKFTDYLDLLDRVCVFEGIEGARQIPIRMLPETVQAVSNAISIDTEGN